MVRKNLDLEVEEVAVVPSVGETSKVVFFAFLLVSTLVSVGCLIGEGKRCGYQVLRCSPRHLLFLGRRGPLRLRRDDCGSENK